MKTSTASILQKRNGLQSTKFKVLIDVIEAQYEEKDFSAKVQTLYNELRMRNKFEKTKRSEISSYVDIAE